MIKALNRSNISVPVRWLVKNNLLVGRILDYGCGQGKDADYLSAYKYDPKFFPKKPVGLFDSIISIYVLNVLENRDIINVLEEVNKYLVSEGRAYFAVRRDYYGAKYNNSVKIGKSTVLHKLPSIRNIACKYEIYAGGKNEISEEINFRRKEDYELSVL